MKEGKKLYTLDTSKSSKPALNIKFEKKQSFFETCGLYYKLITIVIDAASVMLQIVALLTIVIDVAS